MLLPLMATMTFVLAAAAFFSTRRMAPVVGVMLTGTIMTLITDPHLIVKLSESFDSLLSPSSADPVPTPAPTPAPTPSSDPISAPDVDWMSFLPYVGVLLALGVLATGAWVAQKRHKAAREKREILEAAKRENALIWDQAVQDEDKWAKTYLSFQSDAMKIALYPAMVDLRDSKTAKAVAAMSEARFQHLDQMPHFDLGQSAKDHPYVKAVEELRVSMQAAVQHAQVLKDKNFSREERATLRTVINLLSRAEDTSNHDGERETAYARAIDLLKKLIPDMPPTSVLAIEAAAPRLMIQDAPASPGLIISDQNMVPTLNIQDAARVSPA